MTISVILNSFKRTDYLSNQINSLKNQTIKPNEIFLWNNSSKLINNNDIDLEVFSSKNLGVWGRFSLALNTSSQYICLIDDDTIPGKKWFENCINSMNSKEGVYGARGINFCSKKDYIVVEEKGIYGPCNEIERVDIVGHNWFFKRDWLPYFWLEMPEITQSRFVGEDMNLSYSLKKYLNLDTFVPPHPKNDKDLWGGNLEMSLKLGQLDVAISKNKKRLNEMNEMYRFYVSKGLNIHKINHNKIKGYYLKLKRIIKKTLTSII